MEYYFIWPIIHRTFISSGFAPSESEVPWCKYSIPTRRLRGNSGLFRSPRQLPRPRTPKPATQEPWVLSTQSPTAQRLKLSARSYPFHQHYISYSILLIVNKTVQIGDDYRDCRRTAARYTLKNINSPRAIARLSRKQLPFLLSFLLVNRGHSPIAIFQCAGFDLGNNDLQDAITMEVLFNEPSGHHSHD